MPVIAMVTTCCGAPSKNAHPSNLFSIQGSTIDSSQPGCQKGPRMSLVDRQLKRDRLKPQGNIPFVELAGIWAFGFRGCQVAHRPKRWPLISGARWQRWLGRTRLFLGAPEPTGRWFMQFCCSLAGRPVASALDGRAEQRTREA